MSLFKPQKDSKVIEAP